jgi:hypothetical protein
MDNITSESRGESVCAACRLPDYLCRCWDDDDDDFIGYPTYDEIYPEDELL